MLPHWLEQGRQGSKPVGGEEEGHEWRESMRAGQKVKQGAAPSSRPWRFIVSSMGCFCWCKAMPGLP